METSDLERLLEHTGLKQKKTVVPTSIVIRAIARRSLALRSWSVSINSIDGRIEVRYGSHGGEVIAERYIFTDPNFEELKQAVLDFFRLTKTALNYGVAHGTVKFERKNCVCWVDFASKTGCSFSISLRPCLFDVVI